MMENTVWTTDKSNRTTWRGLAVAGGLLGAFVSSSCCMIPLMLFSLGAGGAWVGNLMALAPYQPIFVVLTLGFLGYGFWLVYRSPAATCGEGEVCAHTISDRFVEVALWTATLIVALALAFPFIAPTLLE